MNLKLVTLVLLVSFSCQQKQENKEVLQLREKLPQIETPVKFNSDLRVKYKTVELPNNSLIEKINERSPFSLLGKLFETENNITILGYTFNTIGTPVLITFDNEGKEISTHVIFETAKSELGHYTSNRVTIFPNKQIEFTDSTITREINKEGTEEIVGTGSLVLTRKKYLIIDSGVIKELQ